MAAKDKGADVFDALGAGAIDDGVDQAGPSLQHLNEFLYVLAQRTTHEDVLRFTVLEEGVFVGVNRGPWLEPAWFVFDLFGSNVGVFPLSAGKAGGPEDEKGLGCCSEDLHGESDGLVTALPVTDGRATGLIGADGTPLFTRFSANPCRPETEASTPGPTEGCPFSLCCWPRLTARLLGPKSDASESPRRAGTRDLRSSSARAMIDFISSVSTAFDFHGLERGTSGGTVVGCTTAADGSSSITKIPSSGSLTVEDFRLNVAIIGFLVVGGRWGTVERPVVFVGMTGPGLLGGDSPGTGGDSLFWTVLMGNGAVLGTMVVGMSCIPSQADHLVVKASKFPPFRTNGALRVCWVRMYADKALMTSWGRSSSNRLSINVSRF